MSSTSSFKKSVRLRMADTGEKYTTARRFLLENPAELKRLKAILADARRYRLHSFTDRDGLDRRHVLSAFETQRRKH